MFWFCSAFALFVIGLPFSRASTNGISYTYREDPLETVISQSQWECLKQSGHTLAIIPWYVPYSPQNGLGVAESTKNARAAEMSNIESSFLPHYGRGSASSQMRTMTEYLRENNATIDKIWLRIFEDAPWIDSSVDDHVDFIRELIREAEARDYDVGIYTSALSWNVVTGNSTAFSKYQLWYINRNQETNFKDFRPFGGWLKPTMKEYALSTHSCVDGDNVDKSFRP